MRRLVTIAVALAAAGCTIPQDPDGTLDRVEGGTMRVGVSHSEPWVELDGGRPVGGVEVELVREFARSLDARVEWVDGSEEELVNATKEGSLDLVIGGLTSKSRWKKDVALTRPYVETATVVAAPPGSSFPDDLDGVTVSAELGGVPEALAERKTDARVEPVDSLAGSGGPVVAEEFVIDDLGLQPLRELHSDKHVMASRMGENAFLVRLERFLLDREGEIERLVRAEGKP